MRVGALGRLRVVEEHKDMGQEGQGRGTEGGTELRDDPRMQGQGSYGQPTAIQFLGEDFVLKDLGHQEDWKGTLARHRHPKPGGDIRVVLPGPERARPGWDGAN